MLCAEYTFDQKSFNEAAYLFINANNFTKALESFVLALNYSGCRYLYLIGKINEKEINDSLTTIENCFVLQSNFNKILQLKYNIVFNEVFFLH